MDSAAAESAGVSPIRPVLSEIDAIDCLQRRDPAATDHPMSVPQLRTLAPGVDWPAYFRAIGLTVPVERVNVAEPEFFRCLSARVAGTPLADWRPYLRASTR